MSSEPPRIQQRKAEHLELCASGEVDFRARGTLLDEVALVHDALPELALDEVDLSVTVLGRRLRAPLIIAGMTGGTPEAGALNRDLARAAERLGLGFGLGSQRAMLLHPELADTYQVRDVAPTTLVLGNLGLVQARDLAADDVRALARAVGADALCVHLSTAMELVQPGGDRDFRGGLATFRRLVADLDLPVVAKETGCGVSRRVGLALRGAGVRAVDVSGAGGTSWVGVETHRAAAAGAAGAQRLGQALWDWGVPTAASVGAVADLGLEVLATGGIRSGMDVARALALGATACGLAAPVLRAHRAGGVEGVLDFLTGVLDELRAVCLLTGCRRATELARAPRVLGPTLQAWLQGLGAPAPKGHR